MAKLYYLDYIKTTVLQIQRVSIVDKDELNKDDIKIFEKETNSKLFDLKEFMKHLKVEV